MLQILLQRFTSCSGSSSADSVSGGDNEILSCGDIHLPVMCGNSLSYLRGFFPLFNEITTDKCMGALCLEVHPLTDVMKQSRLFGDVNFSSQFCSNHAG